MPVTWVPLEELTCGCVPSATGIGSCALHYRAAQMRLALDRCLAELPPESHLAAGVQKLLELTDAPAE